MNFSIVVPIYNEEDNIAELYRAITTALDGSDTNYEIIMVDDGSADGSFSALKQIAAQDQRVKVIRFRRNFGQTAAMSAGFDAAAGDIIIPMDGDLQNDPRDIPRMLACLDGYDAVTGWRQRRDDPWLKRVSSRVANAVRNAITREDVHDSACTLRVMRRGCLGCLPRFRGFHRFVPTLLRMAGCRVLELPVSHRARRFGVSHYGIRNRALVAFEDLLAVRWMQSRRLRYDASEEP